MRRLWTTVLLLSICLMALIPPTLVRGDDDETSTSSTTTSATTSATRLGESTHDFIMKVNPPYHTVRPNGKIQSATYAVEVKALSRFHEEVELSVKGLPESSKAIFNPDEGVPNPVFISILKVFVDESTRAGVYTLTIFAAGDHVEHNATTTLVVERKTAPQPIAPYEKKLKVTVSTSQENYLKGDNVEIFGYVKVQLGGSVTGATISVDVVDPTGKDVHVKSMVTDRTGRYMDNFTLQLDAIDGTYAIYVSASAPNYRNGFARVTFTVGASETPSIRIVNATIAAVNGTVLSEFHAGQTVVIWVGVNNSGADLTNGRIWVEVVDPNNVPIIVVVQVVTIHKGEQFKTGIQVVLRQDAPSGTYTVRCLVSNAPITEGGRFLDMKETAFVVT